MTVASKAADATLLRIDFGAKLYSGKSQTLQLSFDLPGQGSAASRLVRMGKSLVTFPVWAYASDGATGSRVTVRFPAGYDVTVESGAFATRGTASDGGTVLGTGALASPWRSSPTFPPSGPRRIGRRRSRCRSSDGKIALTLRAWADDPAWATRVGALFPRRCRSSGTRWASPGPTALPVVVKEAVSRTPAGLRRA